MPLLPRRRSTLDILAQELRAAQSDSQDGLPTVTNSDPSSDNGLRPMSLVVDEKSGTPSEGPKLSRRLSARLLRHVSDSQLAASARTTGEDPPSPLASPLSTETPTPIIMTTAPTMDFSQEGQKKKSRANLFRRTKSSQGSVRSLGSDKVMLSDRDSRSVFTWGRKSVDSRRSNNRLSVTQSPDDTQPRPSESSLTPPVLSTSMSGDNSRRPTSPSRKTSIFTLPRREKRKSLFPLPIKIETPQYPDTAPATPRESTSGQSGRRSGSPLRRVSPAKADADTGPSAPGSLRTSASQTAFGRNNVSFAPPYPLIRNDSNRSVHSAKSSGAPGQSFRFGFRDRASTNSTFGRPSDDATPPTPPTVNGSARNSTSTSGRASLGGLLTLNRFRTDMTGSPSNSTAKASNLPLPERAEGETAAKYLERLQTLASKNIIAGMLSKSSDTFFQNVLRSYTRRFAFFGEPIDMSLRKFLLEAELPKETQQVDRVVQAFADRYHECNPGIFQSPDQAYIIAFSLMMLHTDAFNRNNKYKMQKADYIKNLRGQQVSEDILACFYDNICYTPFIHFDDDDFDANSDRLSAFKNKKAKLKGAMPDPAKKSTGPVDPYSLIIDNKLDALRPSLKDSVVVEDPYSYLGAGKTLDQYKIQRAFQLGGILQIISARSRPAAFESHITRENPTDAKPGVVDLRVTKVGILWRKSTKRKKARSPWQEWGAILTGSQLYFFKNVGWVKNLMQQYNAHQKHMVPPSPVTFAPPLDDFKPDSHVKIDEAVALVDATYTRHKNAFTLIRHGGEEEVLLADNEAEHHEWLSLINYSAAFRAAGVRIRPFVGEKDDTKPPMIRGLSKSGTTTPIGDASFRQFSDPAFTLQIMAARRKRMIAKMAEAEIKIADTNKQLDTLLRDARHLLLLAPIQPKTREVVIHTAARMEALLKWTRRDMWRSKCYKDILYMDALEDSEVVKDDAARMRPQSMFPIGQVPEDEDELVISRPQSSAAASDDLPFNTPPQSKRSNTEQPLWSLPAIELGRQLDADPSIGRYPSTSSAVPSSISLRRPSTTQVSSASSVNEISRHSSYLTNDNALSVAEMSQTGPVTPSSSIRRERETLAPATSGTTSSSIRPGLETPAHSALPTPSPDSAPQSRLNRHSLHRSLRDGHHEGSVRRHRKARESISTIKSDEPDNALPEGTPGLERSGGRFIFHGKQASVITFGEAWNAGDMRLPTSKTEESKGGLQPPIELKAPAGEAEAASISSDARAAEESIGASAELPSPSEEGHGAAYFDAQEKEGQDDAQTPKVE